MNTTEYVILGGGMVAGYAAKEMVNCGLDPGKLAIISADSALAYERPPLSKSFLSGKDNEASLLINGRDWYREHGIEMRLRTVIEHVDPRSRRIRTGSGEEFEFQNLLLATGARARQLECPGNELHDVFYLRSLKDSESIRSSAATAKQAVVIGGGFIGMAVASAVAEQENETTPGMRGDREWSRM